MRRGYKWIAREIAGSDPHTDYERIVALTATYYQPDFVWNVIYSTAVMTFTITPWGSNTLTITGGKKVGEGKVLTQHQKRADDTLQHFWQWFEQGPSSPEVRRSVEFVNRLHMAYAKQLPGHFAHNDEFVHALCWMGAQNHRFRLWLGVPGYTENQKIAAHRFCLEMAALFRSEKGALVDFPEDFAAMLAMLEEYESRPWPAVAEGNMVAEAIIAQFCDRWFPRRLRFVGRQLLLAVTRDRVREIQGLERPRPGVRPAVRLALKAVTVAQERILPDPRRSTPERARRKSRLDPMHEPPQMTKEPLSV